VSLGQCDQACLSVLYWFSPGAEVVLVGFSGALRSAVVGFAGALGSVPGQW
jgi:hypothetical protein